MAGVGKLCQDWTGHAAALGARERVLDVLRALEERRVLRRELEALMNLMTLMNLVSQMRLRNLISLMRLMLMNL